MEKRGQDPLSRGLEIFQGAERVGELFLYRISLGFFGIRREGVGWGPSLEEARAEALEEAMALWDLPKETRAFLRRALLRAEEAEEAGPEAAQPSPQGSPSEEEGNSPSAHARQGDFLEFPPADESPPLKENASGEEAGDAYSIVRKLLAHVRKAFGEEAIREIYAKADLPYVPSPGYLPNKPEEVRLLYRTARKVVAERKAAPRK